jgi:hypothetical protein
MANTQNAFVATYDPAYVKMTWNAIPILGYADGTFVKVVGSADRFVKMVGADGEVARGKTNDTTREVTITLLFTSPVNLLLSAQLLLDTTVNGGMGPMTIEDLLGGVLFFAPQAWIKKAPDWERGKTVGNIEWIFDTGQIAVETYGGSFSSLSQ